MSFFHTNIEKDTLNNKNYREVISTQANMQLVLMSLKPGEEIGEEVHENVDQFFRIEKGKGIAIVEVDGKNVEHKLTNGSVIIIPKGTRHNIKNNGKKDLKLYTIYSPKNHDPGKVDVTKPEQNGGFYKNYLKYKMKYIKLKNNL